MSRETALIVPPEIIRIPTTDMAFMSVLLWLTNNHALQLCRSETINPVHIQQFASHRTDAELEHHVICQNGYKRK